MLYELVGYIADLEEQWMVAGLGKQTCPHCDCDSNHLGDDTFAAPRTPHDILQTIRKIKQDYKAAYGRPPSLEEFMNQAADQHLNGVDRPFWRSLPQINIFEILCPDWYGQG